MLFPHVMTLYPVHIFPRCCGCVLACLLCMQGVNINNTTGPEAISMLVTLTILFVSMLQGMPQTSQGYMQLQSAQGHLQAALGALTSGPFPGECKRAACSPLYALAIDTLVLLGSLHFSSCMQDVLPPWLLHHLTWLTPLSLLHSCLTTSRLQLTPLSLLAIWRTRSRPRLTLRACRQRHAGVAQAQERLQVIRVSNVCAIFLCIRPPAKYFPRMACV